MCVPYRMFCAFAFLMIQKCRSFSEVLKNKENIFFNWGQKQTSDIQININIQLDPVNKIKREESVAKSPTAKPINQFGHMRYLSVI